VIGLVAWFSFSGSLFARRAPTKEFETYRQAIETETGVNIAHYREHLNGGKADGKDITHYNLTQLLKGISVETEHTNDKMIALEIATDHLEEFPEYYTFLAAMEKNATQQP